VHPPRQEIEAVVAALGDLALVLQRADAADTAEICAEFYLGGRPPYVTGRPMPGAPGQDAPRARLQPRRM
jgi:hypothetical protein